MRKTGGGHDYESCSFREYSLRKSIRDLKRLWKRVDISVLEKYVKKLKRKQELNKSEILGLAKKIK